jgi:hypothetical protein
MAARGQREDAGGRTIRAWPARRFAILAAFAFALAARGEIVDRIAVSVGNAVITMSDVDRAIRVTAFLNGKPPDFSAAAKRATADRLVEQQLIRKELETNRYPMPSAAEAAPIVDKFVHDHYKDAAEYDQALAAAGISAQDVAGEVLWQRALLAFIDARFRLGVQVSDRDVEDYFEQAVKPAAEAAHPGVAVSLDDYRRSIEETLAGPIVDRQLDEWLTQMRRRTQIVYHEEALQ